MGFRERANVYPAVNQTINPVHAEEHWLNANTGEPYAQLTYNPACGIWDTGFKRFQMHDVTNPLHHGKYLKGGDMSMCKYTYDSEPCNVSIDHRTPYKRWIIEGDYFPQIVDPGLREGNPNNFGAFFGNTGAEHGAKAYNRFKPGKPKVQSSVFIAELRDLPRMLQAKAYAHRNLGKHYLNVQFGWLPFLSDVRKMIQTYHQMDRIMKNTIHLNGKWIRRGGSVQTSESLRPFSSNGTWGFAPGTVGFEDPSKIRVEGLDLSQEKIWFVGRFRYYIPNLERKMKNPAFRANFIRKVYGLTITPADLWEAMPWSWLIDYFSNVGDVMSNISSGYVDCVAKYAYLMKTTTSQCAQTSYGGFYNGTEIYGSVIRTCESKHRVSVNPFGLELGSESLSPKQLAILAALGISRLS